MSLTDKERAAMVQDLREKAREYKTRADVYAFSPGLIKFCSSMALNYEALAQALAERKPFEAVA